jgi:hypothetical protein
MGISGENISNPPDGAPPGAPSWGGPPACQDCPTFRAEDDWLLLPLGAKAAAEAAKREAIAIVNFIVLLVIIIININNDTDTDNRTVQRAC